MTDLIIWSIGLDRKDGDPVIRRDQLTIIKPETDAVSSNEEIATISSDESILISDDRSIQEQESLSLTLSTEGVNLVQEETNFKQYLTEIPGGWNKLDRDSDHAQIPINSNIIIKSIPSEALSQERDFVVESKEETKHKITKSFRNIYSRLIS